MVEQSAHNRLVAGSIPAGPTKFLTHTLNRIKLFDMLLPPIHPDKILQEELPRPMKVSTNTWPSPLA